ncbi:histidine phosphatase family protein [Steroidobacter sp. S1-65]|uniref:Histidine phosphatase family protein n=1 Tax=Steroidobacter gossypii TaxID=2805490 RepID=A0ABS1X2S8_9GAMM|nr:histidine phosphatase family protein [Steroidobacter gossypii]MBM0107524.1 histidine phosphatase family protein [Steroidobacter gossypii]
MELYLIRHTAPAVEKGICYGRADIPLAHTADTDIQRALAPLPRFDLIYSSPAQRCTRLANALAERDGCELRLAPELQELHFGQWEQLPWARIPREHSDTWAADPWNRAPPGGETEQALWTRVATWYRAAFPAAVSCCAIVAHGGPLRVLRCLALGQCMEQRWSWSLAWGEHARFVLPPG